MNVVVDSPAQAWATLVFGHGAGGHARSPELEAIAGGLARRGLRVVRFDFGYRAAGRKIPDAAAKLVPEFVAVAGGQPTPLFLGGRSLGGRVATMAAAGAVACRGVVVLGYPLHPPERPSQLRLVPLERVSAPVLIFQGERDPFGGPPEFAVHAEGIPRVRIEPVPMTGHEFAPRSRAAAERLERVLDGAAAWMRERA